MARASDDEPTLAVCIRCAQLFRARDRCPYCADLHIVVLEASDERGPWRFEVWEGAKRSDDGGSRVVALDGFPAPAEAHARAHEFIRRFVAERIALRRRRDP